MTEQEWVRVQFWGQSRGYACELGAHDGIHKSNTLELEHKGWDVLCIEPNERHHEALRRNRKLVLTCACDKISGWANLSEFANIHLWTHSTIRDDLEGHVALYAGHVPVLTLDQCLTIVGFPKLDLLSLDVDGIEADILAGFTVDRWKPHALILECDEDPEVDAGLAWAKSHGYRLDQITGDSNHCFLKD